MPEGDTASSVKRTSEMTDRGSARAKPRERSRTPKPEARRDGTVLRGFEDPRNLVRRCQADFRMVGMRRQANRRVVLSATATHAPKPTWAMKLLATLLLATLSLATAACGGTSSVSTT